MTAEIHLFILCVKPVMMSVCDPQGGGVLSFFFIHCLWPSIYRSPKKISGIFKHPQKNFDILPAKKNITKTLC